MAQVHIHKAPAIEAIQTVSTLAAAPGGRPPAPASGSLLASVLSKAAEGRYEQAIKLARGKGGQDPDVQNAVGICLMRTGEYEEAVRVFRGLVLNPGCTWMRRDRPVHYKVNFATALLLQGHTCGCMEMLGDLDGQTTPAVNCLKTAIRKWEKGLPWLAWIDWKLNRISSPDRRVAIDFPPGEFGFAMSASRESA